MNVMEYVSLHGSANPVPQQPAPSRSDPDSFPGRMLALIAEALQEAGEATPSACGDAPGCRIVVHIHAEPAPMPMPAPPPPWAIRC
jgi:hypothetical protein